MTTRAEVIGAIEAVEARVERMAPAILAHADARLPVGEWCVRDALCHLAARSNSVPMVVAAAEELLAAKTQGGSERLRRTYNIDEVNRQQIDSRQDRTPRELLGEIGEGHRAEIAAVSALDQEWLDQRIPSFTGQGDMSIVDLVLAAGPGHDTAHLDQIERAIYP
jgi:hypothetical protein